MAVSTSSAQESQSGDPWKFKAALYFWGASINGSTQNGSNIDIPFDELFDNLNFAIMGGFAARKDKWSAALDVIYMDASGDKSGTITPSALPSLSIPVSADVDLTGWVVNLNGARNVYDGERASVDVLVGLRYLDVESKLTVSVASLPPGSVKSTDTSLDGVVGARGQINLSKTWFIPYYVDVGTGQSDFTWQGFGGVGYSFKPVDVVVGYRYLYWNFDSSNDLSDLSFSGPLAGVVFKF